MRYNFNKGIFFVKNILKVNNTFTYFKHLELLAFITKN